jgi:haloalkane dehalogenase
MTPDAPGAEAGQAVYETLTQNTRPTLLLWADSDPVLPLEPVEDLTVIEEAGHFLQEDRGEHIGRLIAGWLAVQ